MRAQQNVENEVGSILNKLLQLYTTGDPEMLLDIFSADPDVTIIGTQPNSKYTGLDDIKEHFKQIFDLSGNPSEFSYENLMVSGTESVAWAFADLNLQIPTPEGVMKIFARLTAVLQLQEEKWKITQIHYSMPTPFVEQ